MQKIRIFIAISLFSPLLLGLSNNYFRPSFSPKTTTILYKLGESPLQLKVTRYGEYSDLVMINLHDDEFTSVIAAKKFLETEGGILITIENNNKRNIRFRLMNRFYSFDPNRMFSREGIIQSLTEQGRSSNSAVDQVERFAMRVIQLLPENPACIIALHNNTDGDFSVNSYTAGNKRSTEAKAVYTNPSQDPDDLFLTTDPFLYNQLAEKKYNVILQDNRNAKKDGSLSVYCGEKGIRYMNCETEHGKTAQYLEMIMTASRFLERTDETVYNFSIETNKQFRNNPGQEIYFGEKKIGRIRSLLPNGANYQGKLEISKKFPLYSNMDFVLHIDEGNNPRFELTIDPTRSRKKLNQLEDAIVIKLKEG
jgi:hypothetical protein